MKKYIVDRGFIDNDAAISYEVEEEFDSLEEATTYFNKLDIETKEYKALYLNNDEDLTTIEWVEQK